MEETITLTFKIVFVALIMLLLVRLTGEYEKYQSEQTEQYCTVDNKYIESHIINKIPTRTYYIDVHVTESPELTHSISVPASFYDEIEVGMEIKCILYYTDENLVDMELAD